jgi:hypothetical protein
MPFLRLALPWQGILQDRKYPDFFEPSGNPVGCQPAANLRHLVTSSGVRALLPGVMFANALDVKHIFPARQLNSGALS